ncbi:MBL fold metallo-hydrolase [Pseudomonas panipatensis]|uniref:Glyoxylase, beta-lactamase superfamily II n=1 Tax=Pseudomonas panipatensis TaxID=428992 RepID=A0A1G8CCS9_9PSED|nr:MBL fold metallo-hydrolase [Pseudomonas panipatensis]SDH43264.1 Glyoxylase, beta-lactamase superfamily II [Pseudomonas panipatensis]SMP65064.1 Glyoxylase, beta-lactamase superfamily II [Pseudomonas panipatensis]
MRSVLLILALLAGIASLHAEAAGIRFALVRTSGTSTLEALSVAGGSWIHRARFNHTAVLIQHHAATLLFDTGLGSHARAQFDQDMPWWGKPLFRFGEVKPVRAQLNGSGIRVDRILLSHAHWDHASGLSDFPDVPVWAPYEEIEYAQTGTPPAVFPSEFSRGTRWTPYEFSSGPFLGFDASLDLFGDGSLVLVPMPGHSPGSVGLFVTLEDGRRFLFSGDTSWRLSAFDGPHEKFWISRKLVDQDRQRTLAALARVRLLMRAHPEISVIPAHDADAQDRLGYYPTWIQ